MKNKNNFEDLSLSILEIASFLSNKNKVMPSEGEFVEPVNATLIG